ncbi:MAG TPA: tetratricopeptide repeat protein [Pseudolabrys sp.]|nr:tetratricopeptide repeat protein [Pseudolabrys sp.]
MPVGTISLSSVRACAFRRVAEFCFALAVAGFAFAAQPAPAAEPVKGELAVETDGGYLRLAFRFADEVKAQVTVSGAVMVIKFDRPVAVAVDKIAARAADYVSAARRDPDGSAIRLALAHKLKVHVIPAAERIYIDLLPPTWTGILPGLPQEVIDELAERARTAERELRRVRGDRPKLESQTIQVRVGTQPTFRRYEFRLPEGASANASRSDGKLTLSFDQPIKWDLADARASLPKALASVNATRDDESAQVVFTLNGKPEVRAFLDGRSFMVDVGNGAGSLVPALKLGGNQARAAPDTTPAVAPAQATPASRQIARAPAAPPPLPGPEKPAMAPAPGTEKLAAPPRESRAAPPDAVKPKMQAAHPAPSATPQAQSQPAPAPQADTKAAPPARRSLPVDPKAPVVAAVALVGDNLNVDFPFAVPTPAAVFRRADTLWLVFDSEARIDVSALKVDTARIVRSVSLDHGEDGEAIVRIRLVRPQLAALVADGPGWNLTIGDSVIGHTRPLGIARNIVGRNRASITIPIDEPKKIHRITDPDMGNTLMVITALGPARGFLKEQDFVELRALESTHGVVIQPIADDISAELAVDKVVISRPGGLTISAIELNGRVSGMFHSLNFDTQLWKYNRKVRFSARQSELIGMAASAPEQRRNRARYNLARFYLARGMSAEAGAVASVALDDRKGGGDEVSGLVLRAVSDVLMQRPEAALKVLSNPQIGNQHDAPIWRAMAYAQLRRWDDARDGFKNVEGSMAALPVELQRLALMTAARVAIEVSDFSGAAKLMDEIATIGIPPQMQPSISVLTGRLDQGLGRNEEALAAYHSAVESDDRRAAAEGHLHEIELKFSSGEMSRDDAIRALETLTTVWRGDDTEVEGLKLLAHLYTEEKRYRDAFHVMRSAMMAHPNSAMTRKIQDEAAATFDHLFLDGVGDSMPPVEALGLFYDYRELTPIGRRGDEMIRKLADRLISVDLLDQAAELLQHQVDHRLQGAARAQVATRLAVIYLMNRKADRALKALQSTRAAGLSTELRDQRLLLEARALSELGRHELALEVISDLKSREAIRLRSDILWAAQRWREAAEQIELLYGNRWKDFTPLTETERQDILRAGIGYALGEDALGLQRFREKYAAKMADGPDRRAFDVVTAPIGTSGAEFRDVARRIASLDTLDAFLRDMHKRYADSSPLSPAATSDAKAEKPQPAPAAAPATQPAAANPADAAAARPPVPNPASLLLPSKIPEGVPLKPDPAPTGSIARLHLPRLHIEGRGF